MHVLVPIHVVLQAAVLVLRAPGMVQLLQQQLLLVWVLVVVAAALRGTGGGSGAGRAPAPLPLLHMQLLQVAAGRAAVPPVPALVVLLLAGSVFLLTLLHRPRTRAPSTSKLEL